VIATSDVHEVDTPVGPARVHVDAGAGSGVLVLGHGAGGGVEAPDLLAARAAGLAVGLSVVRVEQPWRVRGARVAEAAPRLDAAWLAVCAGLRQQRSFGSGPVVVGGRSSGARVACRTADEVGTAAVLALAFPLVPPGRPERSRLVELEQPHVLRLVVQGERDAFGVPPAGPGTEVHVVRGGDHGFAVRRKDGRTRSEVDDEVRETVQDWLTALPAMHRYAGQTET
jgi:predicted alpha/beta-hydrolase family hydrolase